MSQCYVIKQMVNAIACTIELWMHLGGLLSTQEALLLLCYNSGLTDFKETLKGRNLDIISYASLVLGNLARASITQ